MSPDEVRYNRQQVDDVERCFQILQPTSKRENLQFLADRTVTNRRNFRLWNSHGKCGQVTTAISDAAFLAVHFCSYTERRTQYDRPS